MSDFCAESEKVVEELTEALRKTPSEDIEKYPNKYCEVIDNFHGISYVPLNPDHLEFEDLNSEVLQIAKLILKSKDPSFLQSIYEDYRLEDQILSNRLWNEEKKDYDDIPADEKFSYALEYT